MSSPPGMLRSAGKIFGWQRLLVVGIAVVITFGLLSPLWRSGLPPLLLRIATVGYAALLMFGFLERWPSRLPRWATRWALQVIAVALIIPVINLAYYIGSTEAGAPSFWYDRDRLVGFVGLTLVELVLAPWVALIALVRQKEVLVQTQALEFALERSRLERSALDARLRLLQAQVEPHFLFNTLANVRALVDVGSPKAPHVLDRLIAYLRAAVPRLQQPLTTMAQELELVQAYLDVMQLRMPDRLSFAVRAEAPALQSPCPPTTVLTLVENAVRHGIDPAEDGGHIDIAVSLLDCRLCVSVTDTGVGLGSSSGGGTGTGLVALRERLRLCFGASAELRIAAHEPRGVVAQVWLPAT